MISEGRIAMNTFASLLDLVMDAAIVVAENIVRLKEAGKLPAEAAYLGTRQVIGALFASTVTTIAVFLPVLFLKDVEGQLFADLAITISIAVGISLLIALTVMPAAAGGWLRAKQLGGAAATHWVAITRWIMGQTGTRRQQVLWVAGLVLLWKRLESGVFRWPPVTDGVMRLSAAQLAALLDGLDWSRMHVPRLGRPKTAQ
jgi:multidrug efflux pump subunit AcrB